jgi:SAM-dependent methyltransferase
MGYPALLAKTNELVSAAQTRGALGAELRLRQMGKDGDPSVRGALQAVLRNLELGLLDGLEPGQIAATIGLATYALQEALDLIREPERTPGWSYKEPAILQERGRGSRAVARNSANLARQRPALADLLVNCRFLDIGTGVRWLAIEAAKTWPGMRVVGLDIWEPSLQLAATNVLAEGLQDRITLRRQSVTEIDDEAAFDLIWLPSPFLSREVVDHALPRVVRALAPGGFLVFGIFASRPDPLNQALTDLLTIRSGGHPWRSEEVEERLRALDLRNVEYAGADAVGSFVIGRRE